MKQWGYLLSFLLFSCFFIVEDEPGGGDIADEEIDDDQLDNETPGENTPKTNDEPPNSELETLKNTVKTQGEFIQAQQNEKAVNEAVAKIKEKHADFDQSKVYDHLKELAKTDPERAQALNNPIGWENVWHDIKPVEPNNDEFYLGREVSPADQNEEIYEKLNNEGSISVDEEMLLYGKHLG